MVKKFAAHKTMNTRFNFFLSLAVLYALLIFYLSSKSNLGDPVAVLNSLLPESLRNVLVSIEHTELKFLLYPLYFYYNYPDKALHLVLYAGFGFLLYFTLKNSSVPALRNYAFIFAVILGTLYGISDEFHQSFVPGRVASIWDLLADIIGLAIAQAVVFIKGRLPAPSETAAFIRYRLSTSFENLAVALKLLLDPRFIRYRLSTSFKNLAVALKLLLDPRFIRYRLSPSFENLEELLFYREGFLDLRFAVLIIILSIIFILIPPFNQTFLRIIIALPLLLFLPGYLLIAVMFPERGQLTTMERLTLSIGLSIATVVFDGFVLNYTPYGFRPKSIVISLSIFMGILLMVAFFQRCRLKETCLSFSFEDITSFYNTLKGKDTEKKPEYDPALEKTLIITMVFLIILVSAFVIYSNVTREPEKFTSFYILGSTGKAEYYPAYVVIGKPATLLVGVENYEYAPVNYRLRVQLGDRILKEQEIYLKHNTKWLENVTFIPELTSSIALSGADTSSKLEFVLLKDEVRYRSVHLWVKPLFNINNYTPAITLDNGDMEQTSGWNFTSSSESITGSYTNNSWVSTFNSYEISFTSNGSIEYGDFSQNLAVNKEAIATISFYVKDSSPNVTTNKFTKQLLIDDNVEWEAGVGNKSWEQIKVPVFLSKNVSLTFRVFNKIPLNDTLKVWLDDVRIEPYTNKSIRPPRIVLFSNEDSQLEFTIRGMPINTKGNAKIDGANFPGFYYNIDENKSYQELDIVFSDNNTIETGNATYTSTVRRGEISLLDSTYKLINTSDAGLLVKVLAKNEDRTLYLNDYWNLGNDYSLYLAFISSKSDTAILELRKGNKLLVSRHIGIGWILEYSASIAKNTTTVFTTTVFKTTIDSITQDSVKVKGTELYSDTPTILKVGDSIGDFEVIDISATKIIMKNINPIKIKDGALILGGSIRFKVVNDTAFPYAATGEIRGLPQPILPGTLMNISGLNYPGFYYDFENKTSFEELSLNFSYNATVDIGKAIYKARSHGNELYFLGNSYWLPNPGRVNLVSGFSTIRETLPKNGSLSLEDRFTMTLKDKKEKGVEVIMRREKIGSERLFNKTSFQDFYYEMFVNKKNGRFKSNTVNEGEEFEYWLEYEEDRIYKHFSGKIEAMDDQNVTMEITQYQRPEEIMLGMTFGEFEVVHIDKGVIVLRNTKPLKFEPGKEMPILGDAIRIRTSAKGSMFYPIGKAS